MGSPVLFVSMIKVELCNVTLKVYLYQHLVLLAVTCADVSKG